LLPKIGGISIESLEKLRTYILRDVPSHILTPKGQIKPKVDWCDIDSPKKRTNKFVLFAMKSKKANKTNSFVCFLGESMVRQSSFGFI
jgi:hypothetical protein